MKIQRLTVHSLAFVALGVSSSLAEEGSRKPEGRRPELPRLGEYMKRADANGDGKISQEEFQSAGKKESAERFSKMDSNGDGQVDETEMRQMAEKMRDGMRRGLEGPRDGGPRPEGPRDGGPRPEGSRDGGPRPEGPRDGGPRPEGPRDGGPRPEGPRDGGFNPAEMFGRMDKSGDGSIDRDEFMDFSQAEAKARFERADENGDGKISQEEMRQAFERARQMMRGPSEAGGRRPGGDAPGGFRRPPEGGPRPEGAGRPEGGPPREGGFRRPAEGGPRPDGEGPKRGAESPKREG
jgi:Ca2+-binding EF-hand superfamily protein